MTVGVVVVAFPKVKVGVVVVVAVVVIPPILNPVVLGATELGVPKVRPVVAEVCAPSAPVSTVGVCTCKVKPVGAAVLGVLAFVVELANVDAPNAPNPVVGVIVAVLPNVAPMVGVEVLEVVPKVKPVL